MKLTFLVAVLLTVTPLFGADEQFTFVGTVEKLNPREISVKTPRGSFRIRANDTTEVVKDKTYHDFSPVKTGEEISVRCQPESSGALVAVKAWASAVSFAATVQAIRGEEIEALVEAGNGDQRRIIRVYPDTIFGANREFLTTGQRLRIAGLDVGNGVVDATRIALYNTDVPVVGKQK